MEWVETTGRTVEEATEAALDQLGVDETDAELVILAEPRAGLFGRMRGEARVRARVRPTSPRPRASPQPPPGPGCQGPKAGADCCRGQGRWARREALSAAHRVSSEASAETDVALTALADRGAMDGAANGASGGSRSGSQRSRRRGSPGWRPAWERCRSSNFSGRGRPGREQGHGNRCKSTWRNEGAQTARGKRR